MDTIAAFHGQNNGYPVSKTLRFELIPQGKTCEHIERNGLLANDEKRAANYKDAKKLIDNYHRYFIDDVLKNAAFGWTELERALKDYRKDKTLNEPLKKAQDKMRAEIAKLFEKDTRFKQLTAATPKDLFKTLLPQFFETNAADDLNTSAAETFSRFSTYFTGFQENRKNVYSKEDIATSVPHRIVHDNFPKFMQNADTYQELNKKCPKVLQQAKEELKDILGGQTLSSLFAVQNFNAVLTQHGIDFYNQIIGGVSDEGGKKKTRGINEFANQYWQQNKDFAAENRKIKLIPLFNQILSDRSTLSFVPDEIKSDADLVGKIDEFAKSLAAGKKNNVFKSVAHIHKMTENADDKLLSHIFVNAKDLTFVSQVLFGKWDELQRRMNAYAENSSFTKQEKNRWKRETDDENSRRKGEFSFAELNRALEFSSEEKGIGATPVRMSDYFKARHKNPNEKTKENESFCAVSDFQSRTEEAYSSMKECLSTLKNNLIKDSEEAIEKIKAYLDFMQDCLHRLKPLNVSADAERDTELYALFDEAYQKLSEVTPLYNKARNYLTKKTLDAGKYKLTFENPTLANGWDANKEKDNTCIILLKDEKYYLGIMNAENKPKFSDIEKAAGEPCYKKMMYKLLPGPNKMLPKVFFSEKGKAQYNPPKMILEGYENGKHKKSESFDLNFCRKLIDFFKNAIKCHPDWNNFNFTFSDTKSYDDISDFYREVSEQGYKLMFTDIPVSAVEKMIDSGTLYLFQIYSKDFAANAKGTQNLHTLYWKALFSKENLHDVVFKLNGEAELFYREAGVKNPAVHKSGEKMVNRTTKSGATIAESVHDELFKYANGKLHGNLSDCAKKLLDDGEIVIKDVKHEIIKDRHYTQPKFLFHIPITINFKGNDANSRMNGRVRTFLKNNPDINIIGLDRGERHLIYLTLINRKGEIIQQKSFNTIDVSYFDGKKTRTVDYHEKLSQREKERDAARKSWKTIGKIAELKEGYLSAVIHEIVSMMVKHNAIVVMEDLNFGFKRGRFHVEKQVYQKFERALIDKLNYLAFKDRAETEAGGILNGYQLAEKFESFQKLGKQSGFLFYVPAGYTSKIDPKTGFVNMIDLKGLTNVQKKRAFFEKFSCIRYDSETASFAFTFDYKDFGGKGKEEMKQSEWTVCSRGKRIKYDAKIKSYCDIEPTQLLQNGFNALGINWQSGENILDLILEHGATEESLKDRSVIHFYDELYRAFVLILQMRNSNASTGEDYIISPVQAADGTFFDSREQQKLGDKATLPKDADANGAYHIALKGLLLLERFDKATDMKKADMKIKNEEWLAFRQNSCLNSPAK